MIWNNKFSLAFTAMIAVALLAGCGGKKEVEAIESSPKTNVIAGRYTGSVNAPDGNVWGDGTHPNDAAELAAYPGHRGLSYRLAGSFDITVANNGDLSGGLTLYGYYAKIKVGTVPAGGNEASFIVDGASGTLIFKDGRVTGRVSEPDQNKYGNINGGKV